DEDQEQTDEDVDDGQERIHGVQPSLTRRTNESAVSDAPPTRPPSTSASAISARMLSGFTLPPYRIRMRGATAAGRAATRARMKWWTSCACPGVALRPVPIAQTGS